MAATVNASILQALEKSYRILFMEGLENTSEGPLLPEDVGLFLHVDSRGKEEEYDWFEDYAEVREWVDEREYADFKANGYRLANKDWEVTIEIDRNDILDDRVNVYKPRIRRMGTRFPVHRRKIAAELLSEGFTAKGFDGVSFYNAAHPNGDSTYSNRGEAKLTADEAGMNVLKAVILHMTTLKGANGRDLDITPNVIVVPAALQFVAKALYEQDELPAVDEDGTRLNYKVPNEVQGMLRPVVEPRLATATEWHVFDTTVSGIKPFIFQLRQKEDFQMLEEGSEHLFKRKKYLFGGDARYNVGYGMPMTAFGSTGTGTTPVL